jgi:hypothetical protein
MVGDGRSVERDLHQELLKQKGLITTDTAIQLAILLRTASSNVFFFTVPSQRC